MTFHKATFLMDVAIPRRRDGVEGRSVRYETTVGIIPQPDMMVLVVQGDDFRRVHQVYFDSTVPSQALEIFLDDEETMSFKKLLKLGWEIADGEAA